MKKQKKEIMNRENLKHYPSIKLTKKSGHTTAIYQVWVCGQTCWHTSSVNGVDTPYPFDNEELNKVITFLKNN